MEGRRWGGRREGEEERWRSGRGGRGSKRRMRREKGEGRRDGIHQCPA